MDETTTTGQAVDNRCRFCEQPVTWQAEGYDYPRWVHTSILDTVRCPEGMPAGWVAPV